MTYKEIWRKIHWTKPWERRNQLSSATKNQAPRKMMKGYALSLKREKQNDLHDQTSKNQRRRWHFKLKSAKKTRRQWKVIPYSWKARNMIGVIKTKCWSNKARKRRYWRRQNTNTNQKNNEKGYVLSPKGKAILLAASKWVLIKRKTMKGYALPSKGRKDLSWDELQELRKSLWGSNEEPDK